jgi:ATP-dependent protease ClpP protease subunit
MATYKVLGQALPTNTSSTTLYTVPSATSAIVSTISVTNVTGTAATYRVYVVQSGGSVGLGNALVYDATAKANSMTALTLGVALSTGDAIHVASGTGNAITFQAFGSEV